MAESSSIVNRMLRAAKLDSHLYEEVEADNSATGQAFLVVVLASLAAGIGTGITGIFVSGGIWFLWGLLIGLATSIVGWLAWAFLAYILGTTILKGSDTQATYGELLRTIGFSYSPGMIRFFSFIPFLGGLISFAALIWSLIAGVIAVRQALDITTTRAFVICFIGWLVYILIVSLVTAFALGAGALFYF